MNYKGKYDTGIRCRLDDPSLDHLTDRFCMLRSSHEHVLFSLSDMLSMDYRNQTHNKTTTYSIWYLLVLLMLHETSS